MITGAIWAGICIVFDVFGWVLIKHPWCLSFKEFYVDYQPWITLIYLAIFTGPTVGYFELLYGVAYTIKMSYKGDHKIDGYFEYVVSPLEGFWWQEGVDGIDYAHKETFSFVSLIRLPDFVTKADFNWAIAEATKKKKTDFSKVEFFTHNEGLCVQCMHIGSYDDEPATIAMMHEYAEQNGYELDISDSRYHHEIYLSDPRKCEPTKLKTVMRHPIRRVRK